MAGRRPLLLTIAAACGALMAMICLLLGGLVLGPAVDGYDSPPLELVVVNASTWAAALLLIGGVIMLLNRGGRVVLALGSLLSLVSVWTLLVLTVVSTGGHGLVYTPMIAFVSLLPIAAISLPGRPEVRSWRDRAARRTARSRRPEVSDAG